MERVSNVKTKKTDVRGNFGNESNFPDVFTNQPKAARVNGGCSSN